MSLAANRTTIAQQVLRLLPHLAKVAFRFGQDWGVGLDYRRRRYFILDALGARIMSEAIETGGCNPGSIAAEYGVSEELVARDIACFLDGFMAACADASNTSPADLNAEVLLLRRFADLHVPLSATIELTEACNEKCLHCYRPAPRTEYWTVGKFRDTCVELRALGTLQLDFTGGEPLLKHDCAAYLDTAFEMGFVITLMTNATLLSQAVLGRLAAQRTRMVYVSLYGGRAEVHDQVTRTAGSFDRTCRSIERLVASQVPVCINAPVMRCNREEVPALKLLAERWGIEVQYSLKLSPSYDVKRQPSALNVDHETEVVRRHHDPDVRLYAEIIDARRQGVLAKRNRDRWCDAGFRSLALSPDGKVLPCTALRLECGDLTSTTVTEAWRRSPVLASWRERGSRVTPACAACDAYDLCEPCPAGFFTSTGTLDGIDAVTCGFGHAMHACAVCG